MLGHSGTMSINPSLYANAGYDPRKDFAPIALIASMPVALLAHPSVPPKTVAEMITMAKKEPGNTISAPRRSAPAPYLSAESVQVGGRR